MAFIMHLPVNLEYSKEAQEIEDITDEEALNLDSGDQEHVEPHDVDDDVNSEVDVDDEDDKQDLELLEEHHLQDAASNSGDATVMAKGNTLIIRETLHFFKWTSKSLHLRLK